MKTAKNLLMAITIAAALSPAVQLKAEQAEDSIVAPPKTREQLDSWKTVPTRTVSVPSGTVVVVDGSVASPKLREQLESQKKITATAPVVDLAHPRYDNGIVASPKSREQMENSGSTFQIAPIK